jgi:hypothetical protein
MSKEEKANLNIALYAAASYDGIINFLSKEISNYVDAYWGVSSTRRTKSSA